MSSLPDAAKQLTKNVFEYCPRDLCRLGEYRFAAISAIRLYKRDSLLDISLPFALFKAGHHRLSLTMLYELAKRDPSRIIECAKLAAQVLPFFDLNKDQIQAAIALTRRERFSPAMVALIAVRIADKEISDYFLKAYFSQHSFSEPEIELARSFAYKYSGDHFNSLSIAQELVSRDPNNTEAANLAADTLLENGYTYAARRYACLSLRKSPENLYALEILSLALYKEARWKAARRIFKCIHSLTGDDISLLNSLIALPPLALKAGDLAKAILGFDELKQLLLEPPHFMGVEKSLEMCKVPLASEFYLAYEGPYPIRENLEAARQFVRLSASTLISNVASYYSRGGKTHSSADVSINKAALSRIKIGFISRFFYQHSNLEAHYGLIEQIDKSRFCVYLIHRPGSIIDDRHKMINLLADYVIYLNDDFGESCRTLSQLGLDVLFFTDIGMSPLDSVLAMPHLARYQLTSWGLPHTTGVREVDYYLRSSIFADCEGQEQYSEKLIDVDGYIGYFTHENQRLNLLSRDYFLLPPDRFLVGCLQAIHKIHPDFDAYLEDIARIDESILIVISPTESDQQMRRFVDRLKHAAPTAYRQMCILQRTTIDDFISLNSVLDLNLDTIYYGAGITFVETSWCGPPYITLQSNLVRGSVVSRSYRYAGIESPPVAQTKDEYIGLVRRYFLDRAQLEKLRAEIHAKVEGTIYNNASFVRGCESFIEQLVGRVEVSGV